jgi:hypothetical protein
MPDITIPNSAQNRVFALFSDARFECLDYAVTWINRNAISWHF